MLNTDPPTSVASHNGACFATTHWTVILAAGSPDSSRYREALETLCRTYWYPLYAYLRRCGYERHTAEDRTQGFFTGLLEKGWLRHADRHRGRFRSFLLTSLKHFVADEWDREKARKRGGMASLLSLDVKGAETRYALEPTDNLTPELAFQKSWALTVLDLAMIRLRTEHRDAGKGHLFECLKGYLSQERAAVSYGEVATELGMTEGAVKVAVYRLRRRYRDLVRSEVAQTVSGPDEVDDEIQALFTALAQ